MQYFEEFTMTVKGLTFLKYMMLWIFTISVAQIDAMHLNKGEWITNKRWRFISRGAFIAALAIGHYPTGWEPVAYALIFYGIFDHALNVLRDDIPFWHRGTKGIDGIYKTKTQFIITKIACFVIGHLFLYFHIKQFV